jgi:hypothetical protein
LSSPIHSAGRTTFFFFFLLTGHFLCWARRLLFFVCLLPLSSVSTRHFFVVPSGRFHFCWRPGVQFFFSLSLSRHFLCWARIFFSACCRSAASVRATFLFVLSGHFSSAGHAQNFFWTLLLSPRAMLQTFFLSVRSLLLTAMHACQGRQRFFFPVQSLRVNSSCTHSFFLSQPHSTAVCAAFCSCDQSLCHQRSKENIFLSLPCRSVRDTRRAELFFCAVFFCRPVSSAQTLGFDFFGTRNLCSPLFQNPASEI